MIPSAPRAACRIQWFPSTAVTGLAVLLLSLGLSGRARAQDSTHVPSAPPGFRALFNGRNLDGWYGLDPHVVEKLTGTKRDEALARMRAEFDRHWKVENGELVNGGTGPYATTVEEFGDIELLLEYRTVAGADSGIYLRGNPQVQIWDYHQVFNPQKPDRRPHLGSGGLFNNPPRTLGRDPIQLADRPLEEWNTFRIRQIGDRTWVTLNGKDVVEGAPMSNYWDRNKSLPARGPIHLQTHGGEIRWRRIFVREIGAEEAQKALATPSLPNPTHYDVAYGSHPKQVLHFWKAESTKPTPVLMFIHGGGWTQNARLTGLGSLLPRMLASGISVASVEYRFIQDAMAESVSPPVQAPMRDAARALQFLRSKATEWGIDSRRIGASGGSAGACTALWLAFHEDLADPGSTDPVARQSSRLHCAAVLRAQTTLDPLQMKEWTPNSRYGGHAFGLMPTPSDPRTRDTQFADFLARRDSLLSSIREYSPFEHVTADDPPVYLFYTTPPALGQPDTDPTHTANFGLKLLELCQAKGAPCEFVHPGITNATHRTIEDFLIRTLGK